METELCKCNSCDTILYDENPQADAPKYLPPKGVESMEFIDQEFWGCPICKTDEFLVDL